MTQFKFGDRVQDADGKQFVFLRGFLSSCTVAGDDGRTYVYLTNQLQPIPHPDTVRLDWLIKTKHAILPGWCGDVYADNREEIDAAMRIQAAEAV
jgi:hypothetical protein